MVEAASTFTSEYGGASQCRYAVGIPTKDRGEILSTCLTAFAKQTVKPEAIVLVNNNTNGAPIKLPELDINVVILDNLYPVKGMSQGNSIALDWIVEHDFKLAVKWDDDLIPEPDCMAKLLRWIGKYNAAGGCYPRPDAKVWKDGPRGKIPIPDKYPNHIQFFRWFEAGTEAPLPMEILGLYSSYAYSVDRMKEVGGFRLNHSPIAYREDTELSACIGKNIIDPAAIAIHHVILGGGTRSFSTRILANMGFHDQRLFRKSMTKNGINVSNLLVAKEVGA